MPRASFFRQEKRRESLEETNQVEQQRSVREFRRMATDAKPEHPDDPATHRDREPVALGYWLRWCKTVLGCARRDGTTAVVSSLLSQLVTMA
jgi:hypothetical protein